MLLKVKQFSFLFCCYHQTFQVVGGEKKGFYFTTINRVSIRIHLIPKYIKGKYLYTHRQTANILNFSVHQNTELNLQLTNLTE